MAKGKKQAPVVKYLFDGDPSKAEEVFGEAVVKYTGGSPVKSSFTDLLLNAEAFERAVQQNYHDPTWLVALYRGWRERLGDTLTLKDRLSKIRHVEVKTEALRVYNQFLKEWEAAEKNRVAVETTIETADLQKKVKKVSLEADIAEQEARKAENERRARESQRASETARQEEKEQLQHELEVTQLRTKIEETKKQGLRDPLADYRQKKTEETEKKKIDLEVEQEVKKAQREAESTQEGEMEAELRKARNEGYPEAWENEGKWFENLETRRDKLAYVDLIIETYEQKKQRVLQKYGVK